MTSFVGFLFLSFGCLRQLKLDNISSLVLFFFSRSRFFLLLFLSFFSSLSLCRSRSFSLPLPLCVLLFMYVRVRATDRTNTTTIITRASDESAGKKRCMPPRLPSSSVFCFFQDIFYISWEPTTLTIGEKKKPSEQQVSLPFCFRYLPVVSYQTEFSKTNISRSRSLLRVE